MSANSFLGLGPAFAPAWWPGDFVALAGVTALVLIVFGLSAWRRRRRHESSGGADLPFLICPPPARSRAPGQQASQIPQRANVRRAGAAPVADVPAAAMPTVLREDLAASDAESETVFFLPGYFEVCGGPESGRRIRFPATRGVEEAEYTIGRQAISDPRHVRIGDAAVSRRHLRLRHEDAGWTVWNLSETNPAIIEGAEADDDGFRLLDGATIQAGSLVLRYHGPERQAASVRVGVASEEGRRASNQDSVRRTSLADGRELIAVADGMGGHVGGEIASRLALETLEQALGDGATLDDAVREANRFVFERSREEPTLEGMGTTLVALVIDGDSFELANVGDSRAYRVVGSGLEQLTRDHSFVAEAIRAGGLSPEEAETSPWRNVLMRSVGSEAELAPDLFGPYRASVGQRLLLCTDGVHGFLDGARIAEAVGPEWDAPDAAARVCALAIAAGGDDNATAAVIDFEPAGKPRAVARTAGLSVRAG